VVAQPFLPKSPSSSFEHQAKCSKNVPRSIFNNCTRKREGVPKILESFRAKKLSSKLSFEKYSFYSQNVTKFNRLISLNLSEISQLQNKSID